MLQLSSFHLHNSAVNRNTCYYKYIQQTRKNVLWHILAPSAVACAKLHLRASAHHTHVSAFLCNREFLGISYYIKKAHVYQLPTAYNTQGVHRYTWVSLFKICQIILFIIIRMLTNHTFALITPSWNINYLTKFIKCLGACQQSLMFFI